MPLAKRSSVSEFLQWPGMDGVPQLFNVASQRSATVGDMWDQNSGQGGWNLRFIRGFND